VRLALSAIVPAFLAFVLYAAPASAQAPSEGAPAPTTPAAEPSDATDPAAVPVAPSAPPEYDLPQPSTRWNLLFTGLAVTGVSYGLALGASYIWPDGRTSEELRVPIVGPWMAIADTGCPEGESDCSTVLLVVGAIFTGVDGVLQAGGLGIALESAFIPTSSGAKREKRAASDALRVRPVPYVAGRDGVGLGVAGTF
jgi:hypothetical protein